MVAATPAQAAVSPNGRVRGKLDGERADKPQPTRRFVRLGTCSAPHPPPRRLGDRTCRRFFTDSLGRPRPTAGARAADATEWTGDAGLLRAAAPLRAAIRRRPRRFGPCERLRDADGIGPRAAGGECGRSRQLAKRRQGLPSLGRPTRRRRPPSPALGAGAERQATEPVPARPLPCPSARVGASRPPPQALAQGGQVGAGLAPSLGGGAVGRARPPRGRRRHADPTTGGAPIRGPRTRASLAANAARASRPRAPPRRPKRGALPRRVRPRGPP